MRPPPSSPSAKNMSHTRSSVERGSSWANSEGNHVRANTWYMRSFASVVGASPTMVLLLSVLPLAAPAFTPS